MTDTANLGLPFIEGSQAQKHVTHNEALRILDAAIQIAVLDMTRTTPPESPVEGDRHVVAAGAGGGWSGRDDAIASWQDGVWVFLVPKAGWCVWSVADTAMFVYDGAVWREQAASLDDVEKIGINTVATAPNRLSVRSNAALLTSINAADGGSGDMRLQVSKESTANTASVFFSNDYSGRAEFGLVGSDTFKLKMSPDGASWLDSFSIDSATGVVALPQGLAVNSVAAAALDASNISKQTNFRAAIHAAPFDAMAYGGLQVNGGMDISQEWGAVQQTVSGSVYTVDQTFAAFGHAAGTAAFKTQQVGSPGNGFQNCLQLTATTAMTSPVAADFAILQHNIEGYRWARLQYGSAGAQPVTISFWVYATIAGTATLSVREGSATRAYLKNFTISNAATWQRIVLTIPGDQAGTWSTTNGKACLLGFTFACGTTYQGPEGIWQSANVIATSTTTNFFASNGNTVCMTGLCLHPGVEAPSEERSAYVMRPSDQELQICQRYWQRFGSIVVDTAGAAQSLILPVRMRATPTFSGGGAGFAATGFADGQSGYLSQTTRAVVSDLKLNARM